MAQYAVEHIARALLESAVDADFRGWDPFDGLNSRLFRRSGLYGSRLARLAWIQFHKRSAINLRRLCLVPRSANPKGVALFLMGVMQGLDPHGDPQALSLAQRLGRRLLDCRLRSESWPGCAWGYNFDWQARAFYVPRGTPNAITTCYVARALLALSRLLGDAGKEYRDSALDAAEYLDRVHYSQGSTGPYYEYIPGERVLVHNASLWVAALVSLRAAATGDRDMAERARAAIRTSIAAQRADGAWAYGERSHHRFVDGFHTGYNLEAILLASEAMGTTEFQSSLQSGWRYFERNLLLPDGTAKYFDHSPWPLDTHSFAQAILTTLRMRPFGATEEVVRRVVEAGIRDLYLPAGRRFAYQRHRYWINRVDYMRWTQAWAFYALRVFLHETSAPQPVQSLPPSQGGGTISQVSRRA